MKWLWTGLVYNILEPQAEDICHCWAQQRQDHVCDSCCSLQGEPGFAADAVFDPVQEPLDLVRAGFACLGLGPQQFIEQVCISIHMHPLRLFQREYPSIIEPGFRMRTTKPSIVAPSFVSNPSAGRNIIEPGTGVGVGTETLLQLIGAAQGSLPRLFLVLADINQLVAVPAREIAVYEIELGQAPATPDTG